MEGVYVHPSRLKELVHGNVTFRSAYDSSLSKADLKKAKDELGETEEVINVTLQKLKEMLSNDTEFTFRLDDAYLLRFLRYRKFDPKEAYKCMRSFYRVRDKHPDIYHLPPDIEYYLKLEFYNLMPYTNEKGSQVHIIKFGNWKADEVHLCDLLRLYPFINDIITTNPRIQITGLLTIWDLSGFSAKQLSQASHPKILKIWLSLMQETYPWRINGIILFNCNSALYAGLLGIRYMLKKKIADRIIPLRNDLKKLHEYVKPALLPKEYGGLLEDSECYSYICRPILDNVQYLEYERSFMNVKKI